MNAPISGNEMLAASTIDATIVLERAKQFLDDNPRVETVEVLLPDNNGVLRGKWLPRSSLLKAFKGGLKLPVTTLSFDIWGRDIAELVFASGDADGQCVPVIDSLNVIPWLERPTGQMLVQMANMDGTPYPADSRVVLQQVVDRYREKGLYPVVAMELEFYLFKAERDSHGRPLHTGLDNQGNSPVGGQAYSLDLMQEYSEVFHEIRKACEALNVPVDTLVKEAAPSQYEINLHHSNDPIKAADDAIMLKRVIKSIAKKHGLIASFMAKPFGDEAGNGMHVHYSLLNAAGENVYDDGTESGSDMLRHAIAGLADSMEDCMAIFAPNQNSYRRFQPGCHAPLSPSWGYENRTVSLRVPAGDTKAMRIEHRVSGADANPYLVLAAILAGAYAGIVEEKTAAEPTEGNAYAVHQPSLPAFWPDALKAFDQSTFVPKYLNATFQKVYSVSKWQELNEFRRAVSPMEYDAYLTSV